ncbi:universal stress protein [Shimia abyssi]|uniref:Universal stress protein n=1 Tax=Shimia abyssi TaxID=1662395 RepID=A0A2P8FEB5_9RHOB|nr:universal stress protein [Shimia abyssi]PSL20053.1 nucleotide-binding universal stress UspA family protein [Shimia abyssi]
MTDHVLCAVDLTHLKTEKNLLLRAAELATFYNASLSVVTVVPDYGMTIVGSYFKEGTMSSAVEAANTQLHDFVSQTLPDHGPVQHIVEVGTAYEKILDAIERSKADLVVLGAHKPNIMDKLQGPNSARVARHAHCSVLVVR